MKRRIFAFVCGERVVDVGHDERYRLGLGWSPSVAGRRMGLVGGRSRFDEVVERVPVQVRGETQEIVAQGLRELAEMMDAANRYYLEETGEPVVWEFAPVDSARIEPWRAMVVRPVDGGLILQNDLLQMIEDADDEREMLVARAELRFVRRGLWLGEDETVNDENGAVTANTSQVIPFPAWAAGQSWTPSPIATTWTFGLEGLGVFWDMVLAVGEVGSLALYTAVGGAFSGATVAETGAIGDTAVSIPGTASRTVALTGLSTAVDVWHVFVKFKNNGVDDVVMEVRQGELDVNSLVGRVVAPNNEAVLVYAGVAVRGNGLGNIFIDNEGATAILLDSILLVAGDDRASVVAFNSGPASLLETVVADPRALTGIVPLTSNGVSGDAYAEIAGGEIEAVAYGVSVILPRLHFVYGVSSVPTLTVQATRRRGSVVAV